MHQYSGVKKGYRPARTSRGYRSIAQVAVLLFRLSLRKLRNMRKVRKTIRWRRALQSCFFLSWTLKYPARQQSPSSYVRI